MVRWLRWHCPPDTGFEIRALAVWGRARYLSVTEAPHNTDFHTWMGKKHFLFLSNRRDWEPNSGVKGNVAYRYPRAPALIEVLDIHTKHTVPKRSAAIGAMRLSPWAHDGTSACFSGNKLTAGALSWRRARFVAWANQNEAWRSLATRQWNYQNYIKKCI